MPLRQVARVSVLLVLNACGVLWCGQWEQHGRGEPARQGPAAGLVWDGVAGSPERVALCCVRVLRLHPVLVGVSPRGPRGSPGHL